MKTKNFPLIILTFILLYFLLLPKVITSSVSEALSFFFVYLFPSLFPFFLLSEFLLNYGFMNLFGIILRPFTKIFKVSKHSAFVLGISMFSGFPSGARNAKKLYDEGLISSNEATKLLCFTHFSNPLFILSTVSLFVGGNKNIASLILIVHFLTNILIGLIYRNYPINTGRNLDTIVLKRKKYGEVLSSAIINSLKTMGLILGSITIFFILTNILNSIIPFNDFTKCLVNGLLDFNKGFYLLKDLTLSSKLKAALATIFLSFGGFSVHTQVISIIGKTNIKYLPFLISRIIHAILSGLIIYLLFDIFL